MRTLIRTSACAFVTMLATVASASAQAPAPPAKALAVAASAGLALTKGNKDTSTVNIGYELAYVPKTRNVIKSDGLFLRGKTEGDLTTDRLGLNGRDEYKIHDGAFVFGQVQYLADQFKNIDHLVATTIGLGYRLADTPRTKLSADAGAGGVWEKRLSGAVQKAGALTLGEKLTHQLSASAALSQSFAALYRMNNFDDALYTVGASLAASVTARTQLKVEVLDTYKTLVVPGIEKNDVALIVGMVFKR